MTDNKKWFEELDAMIRREGTHLEVPTTITGRLRHLVPNEHDSMVIRDPVTRRKIERELLRGGRKWEPVNIDFAQLELRIMALYPREPGSIETFEDLGRPYHRIKHPYGGEHLEVPCRAYTDSGCPICRLLEQQGRPFTRKEEMLREPEEEQGTEVICVDCKKPFIVAEGEERFLREKFGDDFSMPKRCKPCRQANKERKAQGGNKKHNGGEKKRERSKR